MRLLKLCLIGFALTCVMPAGAHDGAVIASARKLEFPRLLDGRAVLAVDLHTHSVFSDGSVWPDIRVEEARRDGLFALAVSEHLEYQPKKADIPHPDRNRSFELARQAADAAAAPSGQPLLVINGSEITKVTAVPGHMNAVFITDANALLPRTGLSPVDAAREQLQTAVAQGAFTFWNHPYWSAQRPDGVASLDPVHADFIRQGLLHGIEVANGADMSEEAFQIALANNLTILGTSDVHGLIDWDYDLAGGGHRTATLVLTSAPTGEAVKAALRAGDTVAIYKDNLLGRAANVEAVVRSSLRLEVGAPLPRTSVVAVSLVNDSPVDYILQNTGPEGAYDEGQVFMVKAGETQSLLIKNVSDPSKLSLTLKVLNAYLGPRENLSIQLRDMTP